MIATTSGEFPTADWNFEYANHFLSDTAGSVGIFHWDPDTKTAEEAKAGRIDAVGWGSVTYVYETATASTPSSGESIERKSLNGDYAPAQDTDDNSIDFFVQDTPTPKNSTSPKMDPAPVELFDAAGNFKGGFTKIQDAVDSAADGDTVLVHDGTYNENVNVNKRLTIRSENGYANCIVNASNSNDHVFDVTADYVNISGFAVNGATEWPKAGIHLGRADHCNISGNTASSNDWQGIHLDSSSNNNISGNTAARTAAMASTCVLRATTTSRATPPARTTTTASGCMIQATT